EASGATAGEPSGGDPDGCDEAVRSCPCCDRYDGATEGGDVSDRCQAAQPGARATGAIGEETRREPAPILSAARRARAPPTHPPPPHPPPAAAPHPPSP